MPSILVADIEHLNYGQFHFTSYPYSFRMRENADQNRPEYGHFL